MLTAIIALNDLGEGRFEAKLERSPFYPAGGGQVSDAGWIEHDETGAKAELREAIRVGDDQVLVFEGTGFAVGDRVKAVVPWSVRFPTMANHTATHLLHEALRRVLGEHVAQAGSAVRPDKLRFDFTHERTLSAEERAQVEELVNEQIFVSRPVRTFETPIDEARKLGAQMLFGEKYGDIVRVVEIDGCSRELCGGTHVRSTAEIGPVRDPLRGLGRLGRAPHRGGHLRRGLRAPARACARERRAPRRAGGDSQGTQTEGCQGRGRLHGDAGDRGRRRHGARGRADGGRPARRLRPAQGSSAPAAVIVGARNDGTAQLLINLDKSLEGRGVNAGDVIREAAVLIGGKGGGRPTMARAGGKQPERLEDAVALAEKTIIDALN